MRLIMRVVGLLATATLLGIAFNAASPLGIPWRRPAAVVKLPPARPAQPAQQPAVATPSRASPAPIPAPPQPRNRYENRTLAVTTVTPHNPYRNESLPVAASTPVPAPLPIAVTWDEAKALLASKQAVLVDARPPSAFLAGSIPGAVSLPYGTLQNDMSAFQQQYGQDTYLIVYCSDQDCLTSAHVAETLLRDYGYRHVYHLLGGYAEWQRAAATPP